MRGLGEVSFVGRGGGCSGGWRGGGRTFNQTLAWREEMSGVSIGNKGKCGFERVREFVYVGYR